MIMTPLIGAILLALFIFAIFGLIFVVLTARFEQMNDAEITETMIRLGEQK